MTSSPSTVVPSMRTHRPTVDRQPTIQLSSHAWLLIIAPSKIVERLIQAPTKKSIKLRSKVKSADFVLIFTVFYYAIRTDRYIGSDPASIANLRCRMDKHISNNRSLFSWTLIEG